MNVHSIEHVVVLQYNNSIGHVIYDLHSYIIDVSHYKSLRRREERVVSCTI